MEKRHVEHLQGQFLRGRPILFTGAGFSAGAIDRSGSPLPSSEELRQEMWHLVFPDDAMDASPLGAVFDVAHDRKRTELASLLSKRLSVDADKVPETYRTWFSVPWHRVYTLNIDNLEQAVQTKYSVPRRVETVSGLNPSAPTDGSLQVIHLNGCLSDVPDVTFSPEQYGERTAYGSPWYEIMVSELVSRPVVFVGTSLDEAPLWHYLALLGAKGARTKEQRPRSYLVAPSVPKARAATLEQLNVVWVPMGHAEFAVEVLEVLQPAVRDGFKVLTQSPKSQKIPLFSSVSELRTISSEDLPYFLLGREPEWADIVDGYAVEREFEADIHTAASDPSNRVILLRGTAGSGKSTTLMNLALKAEAQGKEVLYLREDAELSLHRIKMDALDTDGAIVIDNLDRFGNAAGGFLRDLASAPGAPQLFTALRSSKYEELDLRGNLEGLPVLDFVIPHLQDADIDLLIDALTRAKRLGELRNKPPAEQRHAFEKQAERQLLVALLQATSGQSFEERIQDECRGLPETLRLPYTVLAVATNLRVNLTTQEVLSAINDHSNAGLNRINELVRAHVVRRLKNEHLRLRHKRVAEVVVDHYQVEGRLGEAVAGLLFAVAAQVTPAMTRNTRERRLLNSLLNHNAMIRIMGSDRHHARRAYADVEGLLEWDYHYWLQRGRFETEVGDLRQGKNFVDQARAIEPDDLFVKTAWADVRLRLAAQNPAASEAEDLLDEGFSELEDAIATRGRDSAYPYEIMARQGLAWLEAGDHPLEERRKMVDRLLNVANEGVREHRRHRELDELRSRLRRAQLMLAVPEDGGGD